jgi:hypothetical protein
MLSARRWLCRSDPLPYMRDGCTCSMANRVSCAFRRLRFMATWVVFTRVWVAGAELTARWVWGATPHAEPILARVARGGVHSEHGRVLQCRQGIAHPPSACFCFTECGKALGRSERSRLQHLQSCCTPTCLCAPPPRQVSGDAQMLKDAQAMFNNSGNVAADYADRRSRTRKPPAKTAASAAVATKAEQEERARGAAREAAVAAERRQMEEELAAITLKTPARSPEPTTGVTEAEQWRDAAEGAAEKDSPEAPLPFHGSAALQANPQKAAEELGGTAVHAAEKGAPRKLRITFAAALAAGETEVVKGRTTPPVEAHTAAETTAVDEEVSQATETTAVDEEVSQATETTAVDEEVSQATETTAVDEEVSQATETTAVDEEVSQATETTAVDEEVSQATETTAVDEEVSQATETTAVDEEVSQATPEMSSLSHTLAGLAAATPPSASPPQAPSFSPSTPASMAPSPAPSSAPSTTPSQATFAPSAAPSTTTPSAAAPSATVRRTPRDVRAESRASRETTPSSPQVLRSVAAPRALTTPPVVHAARTTPSGGGGGRVSARDVRAEFRASRETTPTSPQTATAGAAMEVTPAAAAMEVTPAAAATEVTPAAATAPLIITEVASPPVETLSVLELLQSYSTPVQTPTPGAGRDAADESAPPETADADAEAEADISALSCALAGLAVMTPEAQ